MKIHKMTNEQNISFEYWYDRSVRVWFAIPVDDDGNQIGDTVDSYDKSGLLFSVKRYTKDLFYREAV